jgi:hypothetical protein
MTNRCGGTIIDTGSEVSPEGSLIAPIGVTTALTTTDVGAEVAFDVPNWFVPAATRRIRWPMSVAVRRTVGAVAKPSHLLPFASQRRRV